MKNWLATARGGAGGDGKPPEPVIGPDERDELTGLRAHRSRLHLYAGAGRDALVVGMFYGPHLSDQVSGFY